MVMKRTLLPIALSLLGCYRPASNPSYSSGPPRLPGGGTTSAPSASSAGASGGGVPSSSGGVPSASSSSVPSSSGGTAAGANGGSSQGGSGGQGGSSGVGLPCDVQAILVNHCDSCHGAVLAGGAPRSLVTYADLIKPDFANNSMTEAQVAMQRILSKSAPMPPAPAAGLTSTEISTFQSWVSSGYPAGTCGGGGGASGAGGVGGNGGSSQSGGAGGKAGSSAVSPGGTGGVAGSGLPCDVQTFLVTTCDSCHGTTLASGAPRSLVTYADLIKPDPANPAMTEAQVALLRIQSTTSPMPPFPASPATSTQIALFQNWVGSGYPTGSCSSGGTGGTTQSGSGGSGGTGGSTRAGSSGTSAIVDAGVPGGTLPCNIQTLLVNRCDSCHGTTPASGAPRSLVTYADLTKPDPVNLSMTEAQVALVRMQSTTSPMPPAPAATATSAEIAAMQTWINSGYPSGSCGDAGAPPPDPLNAPPTCTSNTTWSGGTDNSSSIMAPGQACISCHASTGGEAPSFAIAGTLYPTGHEPNNCNGANGTSGAKVVVGGSNGTSITLIPNSAGNFSSSTLLSGPYTAKVVNGSGVERVMVSTASSGDCNSCHTQTGVNGAPGRITLP